MELNMFKTLFEKEIKQNIQNHRFTIAMIVCCLLIPLSFFFNQKHYESRRTSYEESVRLYEDSRKTISDLGLNGAAVYRPPSPLMLLSTGVEYLIPDGVETIGFLTSRGIQTRDINTSSFSNPFASLYGHMDLNFIVCVILSILSVLFSFNSIAGEKENRSLSLIISNAVPRPVLLLAKSAACFLLLSIAFLTGILAGFLTLEISGYHLLANIALLLPFLYALCAGLLIISVMVNLGLLVSTLFKNSITSILVLIVCWAFFYQLLPKSSVILSRFIKPVTSQQVVDMEKQLFRLNLQAKMDADIDRRLESDAALKQLGGRNFFRNIGKGNPLVDSYLEDTEAIQSDFQSSLAQGLRDIDLKYNSQRASQASIARNIARLSPLCCFSHFLVELSRTGILANHRWQETHQRLREVLDREIAGRQKSIRYGNMSQSSFNGDRSDPAPRVHYQDIPRGAVFKASWPDLLLLALYGLLFFSGAFAAFMRYDVR